MKRWLRDRLARAVARAVARDAQRAAARGDLDRPALIRATPGEGSCLAAAVRCADDQCGDLLADHDLHRPSFPCRVRGCRCHAFIDQSRL